MTELNRDSLIVFSLVVAHVHCTQCIIIRFFQHYVCRVMHY